MEKRWYITDLDFEEFCDMLQHDSQMAQHCGDNVTAITLKNVLADFLDIVHEE